MALKGLARKAKEAQVAKDMEALRSTQPDSPVFKFLEQAEAGSGAGDGSEHPLSDVLRKNKGTLSVVAEYRKILKSGFIDGILAPELLCPLLRNGGAACIAVATEPLTGGCSDSDLARVVEEQENSRGDFPGPMPVIVRRQRAQKEATPSSALNCNPSVTSLFVGKYNTMLAPSTYSFALLLGVMSWSPPARPQRSIGASIAEISPSSPPLYSLSSSDLVISEFEIARAKAAGAAGVTVALALTGPERAAELAAFCKKLAGLEAVVQTASQEEIEQAVASDDVSIVSVVGKTVDEAAELKQYIPDRVVSVVHVDRRSDEGLDEIEDCWQLRDAGYHTIWVSEVLYKGGMMQAESAEAILKAIRAKASVKYGRARGMSGKGEGAKEYLGYLAQ
ncbi:unnamed protein product [Scytosiphon promiscuus]